MLDLPASTIFNKRIPKQKFYDNLSITPQQKRVFVEQIKLITWLYKIAPSTMNIASGKTVFEIEVISIQLNKRDFDKRVLLLIDKYIPYHILFLLEYDGEVQAQVGYKEQAKKSAFKPGTYYCTDWLKPDALDLHIDGMDLDMVYENLIRQVAGDRLNKFDDDIKTAINNEEKRQKLEREIAVLEKRVQNEKQFNKQVEMNNKLKRLKQVLEGYE